MFDIWFDLGLKRFYLDRRYLFVSVSFLVLIASFQELQPVSASESSNRTRSSEDRTHSVTTFKDLDANLDLFVQAQTSEVNINDRTTAVKNDLPEQIVVEDFKVVGSSVFSQQELDKAIEPYQNRPLTLLELFEARSTITKLYTDRGYVSSGAYIPPQELNDGTVEIAVLEGELAEINVSGTKHLDDNYILSRIKAAAAQPVKVDDLLSALQLLRSDPLIDNVSAELSAGVSPGNSLLDITVREADVFNISTSLNNSSSPSIGANQRTVGLNHGNLFGFGDRFNFEYANTDGSDGINVAYAVPLNAKNGTIRAAYSNSFNDVIEEPFTPLDIESESHYYELNFRQPILLQPNRELALGMSLTRTNSQTFFRNERFPLSRGAEADGETKISAVRLFQEFTTRNSQQVLAFRSLFNIGVDAFDPTINNGDEPDSTFLSWQGQSQWVRRLDEDFLLLIRGNVQLSGGSLVPIEQFRLGGVDSVRGYRQDLSLGDNGLFASAELRIPVLKLRKIDSLVQITPFFDVGTVWNSGDLEIENSTLPAVGIGLNFSRGTNFNARLDWGIPLTDVNTGGDSLQEDGIYFSLDYNFF